MITGDAVILSSLEALVQFVAKGGAVGESIVTEYTNRILHAFERFTGSMSPSNTVAILSFISSVVVLYSTTSLDVDTIWTILACHSVIQKISTCPVWENGQYTTNHLAWIYVLELGIVLLTSETGGRGSLSAAGKFISNFSDRLLDRLSTAHTSDLGSIEEACLINRLFELAEPVGAQRITAPSFFQFTSLITPKPPSVYPKSRSEKLAGNLESIMFEDVRTKCTIPSVFGQRIVWLAADILGSGVRRMSGFNVTSSSPEIFHSLLDSAHFISTYLKEVTVHADSVLRKVSIDNVSFIPLSVYVSIDGVVPVDQPKSREPASTTQTGGGQSSLLKSLPSPIMTKSAITAPRGSLMDSLSPRNSPKSAAAKTSLSNDGIVFYTPRSGDCAERAGLSFIAPAFVSEEEYIGKLVEVLSLCLIQAMRFAQTEALIRPLLDLLMSMKSSSLPREALTLVHELVDIVAPRYNSFSKQQARRPAAAFSPHVPALGAGPVYSALSNIRY